ncbi:unnamed protein product [Cuscuta campestris]|uniref:Uncharacterized protein n=1 Tax=Cuscuta campestris TaxID=132261 RepID=A0A484M7E9_9ASTE|nr:unnamed protein product [Cuscuta campestris]
MREAGGGYDFFVEGNPISSVCNPLQRASETYSKPRMSRRGMAATKLTSRLIFTSKVRLEIDEIYHHHTLPPSHFAPLSTPPSHYAQSPSQCHIDNNEGIIPNMATYNVTYGNT